MEEYLVILINCQTHLDFILIIHTTPGSAADRVVSR